ncbi:conserved membrane hypothetical protein [Nostocoides japonicum T1-X7]|uniref:ABC3 transporter permease C-terminal domain-containing protein n=1 Tax=Nostocoides japonicum T1-X7 TaxID=1194083 RepID=A0A077M103_9MICO|nr:FtsX-like permease family protein [Tetrasphaera japonica]CCH77869.1 conserved membrane hypothetical protein [Tetrasphaera japonica T1-X7]
MRVLITPAARYRAVETTVIGTLTALVCACVVLTPVLQRAIVQSVLDTAVAERGPRDTGVVVTSIPPEGASSPVVDPATLATGIPAPSRALLGAGIGSVSVDIALAPRRLSSPKGELTWRDGMCQHVRFATGTCPSREDEVAVSTDEARRRGWAVGSRIGVYEQASGLAATLTVTGTYAQEPDRYWFGTPLSSAAGESSDPVFDTMLTPRATVLVGGRSSAGRVTPWAAPWSELDLPVRTGEIRPEQLVSGADHLEEFLRSPNPGAGVVGAPQVTASSGLTDLASDIVIQQGQTRRAVPLLLAQLVAVLLVVLWLVLVALTEQRRPELALARLRGRSPRNSRRVLLSETVPTVGLGAVGGAVLALLVSYAARHWWLDHSPGFSVAWVDAVCLVGAALSCLALAGLSVLRPSRQPIAALLRSVPARTSGFVLGTVEGMLVAVGLAAYLALLTGQVTGPVALAVPAALAAALGIVGARLAAPVLGAVARRATSQGRPATVVGATEAARRPTARWLVPLVALATASVVFGATATAIGHRNQSIAGLVDNGAPLAAVTNATSGQALREAVTAARGKGVDATAVVQIPGSQATSPTTVAVVPDEFRTIASLVPGDRSADLWSRIAGSGVRPVALSGRSLTGRVEVLSAASAPSGATYEVALRLLSADGSRNDVPVATLPLRQGTTAEVGTYLPCGDGCRVIAIVVTPSGTGQGARARVRLDGLRVDGRPLTLGTSSSWRSSVPDPARAVLTVGPGALVLDVADAGLDTLVVDSAASADDPAALATPRASAGAGTTLDGTGLDGQPQAMQEVGGLEAVPGAPPDSVVTSLDVLLVTNTRLEGNDRALVYLARDEPAQLDGLRRALRAQGIAVTQVDRAAELARSYERSAAAWTLRLARWTAVLALLAALLGMVVLVANSWRSRSRDLAALRMSGLTERAVRGAALRELVPLAAAGVVVGVVAGSVGGLSAVATLPLFTHPPTTAVVDLGPAWGVTILAGLVSLAVVVAGAVVMALWTVRRSVLARLRDPG